MADTSLTPMKIAKTDADPTGDLVLVIGSGDNKRSIRASSKVLSLASPVLAAIFRPHCFSEGTALSSSNPPDIYLPHDDPEAFTMFCHLAHLREYHGKRPDPSITQLVNLALLCDKYDAGLAFSPWCELWLHSQLESSKDYGNLLGLAYAFDNHEGFWINSRNMMQYNAKDRPCSIRDELLAYLPQGVFASIDQDRKSALLDLSSRFDNIMASFLELGPEFSESDHLIKAGHFFAQLYQLYIWPISNQVDVINLDYIKSGITKFDEHKNTSFKKSLVIEISKAIDAQKGLCLSCVRLGKVSSHQGNCHARLRYLCKG